MTRPLRPSFAIALVFAIAGFAAAGPASAQERSLRLENFNASIVVRADGDVVVTETLRPRFTGSWNGIFRNLSLRHTTGDGRAERLDLEVISVTGGDGQELRVDRERPDAWTLRLQIWVPDARDAARTVRIRYRVANAIRFFDSEGDPGGIHDELYWNVTGNLWEIPIDGVSADVTLPVGVLATDAWAYTGPEGSVVRDATVQVFGERVEVEATTSFRPGEGLTLSVSWPPGAVPRPGPAARALGTLRLFWPAGVPLLALLGMGHLWFHSGRDPRGRAVVVQYEPPDDLSPAEAGTLVDHTAQMHDLTSTLVDLAVRGFIRIEEREDSRLLGLVKDREYVFHLLKPRGEWDDLETHERRFLNALFSGGRGDLNRVELSDLKDKFYRSLKGIRNAIYDRLVQRGHYRRRPDQVRGFFVAVGIGLTVAGVFGSGASAGSPVFLGHPMALMAGFIGAGVVVLVFGLLMPARTVRGARTREAALGFKEFLARVEEPRYRVLIKSPADFERFLPYAMAFRVEERWAKAFEDLYREPPDWYVGSNPARGFRASDFTSSLSSLNAQASSTFSSSPSGSGGGGGSGGGSGGGGGGGF